MVSNANDEMKRSVCPTCEKAVAARDTERAGFPFCSERCQLADLGKWLDGGYVIAGPPSFED